jgi:hypothetical protein
MYLDHVQGDTKIYTCINENCSSYLQPSEGDELFMKKTEEEARKLAEKINK